MLATPMNTDRTQPSFDDDARWDAVKRRDRQGDGVFYYSVRTTGVYCRPSCAARLPRRENVCFHASVEDAERAGFRPCKRCKPGSSAAAKSAAIQYVVIDCSRGAILIAATQNGVCGIEFGDDQDALVRSLQDRFPAARPVGGDPAFERLAAKVIALTEAPANALDLPLDLHGTAFQQRVWRALRQIAPGATASYAEIAARIGHPKAVRAVARACALNTVAVAIPCHRVVRSDGSPSGYRWGVERKRVLLQREKAA